MTIPAVWSLLILMAIGPPADELSDLVGALKGPSRADRAKSAEALVRAGEPALAVLRPLREGNDLELRAVAAALIDAIEAGRLSGPTRVALAVRDLPPARAVAELERLSGQPVLFQAPPPNPVAPEATVTLDAVPNETFWEAVDRLAGAGGLAIAPPGVATNPAFLVPGNPPQRGPRTGREVVLMRSDGTTPAPKSDSGAFRVEIVGLVLDRSRQLVRPAGATVPDFQERFEARLQVRGEPRLTLIQVEDPTVDLAVDDLGRSLRMDDEVADHRAARIQAAMTQVPMDALGRGPRVTPTIRLRYPEKPATAIARLSGRLPVLVVGRRGDPQELPIDRAKGQTVTLGTTSITVDDVRIVEGAMRVTVDLTIHSTDAGARGPGGPVPSGDLRPLARGPALGQIPLTVLDALGRAYPEQVVPVPVMVVGGFKRTLAFPMPGGLGPPAVLRFEEPTWGRVEIPFTFRDVPLP